MEPTKDHKAIRRWAESRRAIPAMVRGTDDGIPSVLRFIVPGSHRANRDLEEVSWDYFFKKFDLLGLAFVFQEIAPNGEPSSMNEILKLQPQMQDHRNWH